MVGGFGFKVSLIKAFQPHLFVFYGVSKVFIAGFGYSLITANWFKLICIFGGVPEWLNGTVSKIVVGATPPRVRIPPPPPN